MKIKLLCAAAALAIGFASEAAYAEDAPAPTPEFTITGSAAIVSQYRFRGLAQSDNKPAIQGTFTVSHASGFYVSVWGSSGTQAAPNFNNGTEIDVYGGYTHALGKTGITFDGGLYGYIYPNIPDNNIFEVYASLAKSYGPFTAKAGVNWAPKQTYFNFYATPTRYNMYEYAEFGWSQGPWTVHSHIGHTGGGLDFVKQYIDYTVGASYKWKALTLDVSAVGTNIRKSDATANPIVGTSASTYRIGKLVPVVSLTASF